MKKEAKFDLYHLWKILDYYFNSFTNTSTCVYITIMFGSSSVELNSIGRMLKKLRGND